MRRDSHGLRVGEGLASNSKCLVQQKRRVGEATAGNLASRESARVVMDLEKFFVLEFYRDPLIPIPTVLVSSAIGSEVVSGSIPHILIPELPRLLEHICMERILEPRKLVGGEVAFLRKTLAMTGRKLAEVLSVTPETLSRWENNRELINVSAERMLRLRVLTKFASDRPSFQSDIRALLEMKIVSGPSVSLEPEALFFRYSGDSLGAKRWDRVPKQDHQYADVKLYPGGVSSPTVPMPRVINEFIVEHILQRNSD